MTELRLINALRKQKNCYSRLPIIRHVRIDNAFTCVVKSNRFTFATRPTLNRRPSFEIRERDRHVANRNGKKGKKRWVVRHFSRDRKHQSSITLSFLRPITCKKASRFNEPRAYTDATPPRFFPERSSMYPALHCDCGGNAREKQRIGRLEIYFPSWRWLDKTASLAWIAQKIKYENDVKSINIRIQSVQRNDSHDFWNVSDSLKKSKLI